jgi:hypothetical protein
MKFTDWDFALDTNGTIGYGGSGFRPTYYLKCTQLGQFEVELTSSRKRPSCTWTPDLHKATST